MARKTASTGRLPSRQVAEEVKNNLRSGTKRHTRQDDHRLSMRPDLHHHSALAAGGNNVSTPSRASARASVQDDSATDQSPTSPTSLPATSGVHKEGKPKQLPTGVGAQDTAEVETPTPSKADKPAGTNSNSAAGSTDPPGSVGEHLITGDRSPEVISIHDDESDPATPTPNGDPTSSAGAVAARGMQVPIKQESPDIEGEEGEPEEGSPGDGVANEGDINKVQEDEGLPGNNRQDSEVSARESNHPAAAAANAAATAAATAAALSSDGMVLDKPCFELSSVAGSEDYNELFGDGLESVSTDGDCLSEADEDLVQSMDISALDAQYDQERRDRRVAIASALSSKDTKAMMVLAGQLTPSDYYVVDGSVVVRSQSLAEKGWSRIGNKQLNCLSIILEDLIFGLPDSQPECISDFCCSEVTTMQQLGEEQRKLMAKMLDTVKREPDLLPRRRAMSIFSDAVKAIEEQVMLSHGTYLSGTGPGKNPNQCSILRTTPDFASSGVEPEELLKQLDKDCISMDSSWSAVKEQSEAVTQAHQRDMEETLSRAWRHERQLAKHDKDNTRTETRRDKDGREISLAVVLSLESDCQLARSKLLDAMSPSGNKDDWRQVLQAYMIRYFESGLYTRVPGAFSGKNNLQAAIMLTGAMSENDCLSEFGWCVAIKPHEMSLVMDPAYSRTAFLLNSALRDLHDKFSKTGKQQFQRFCIKAARQAAELRLLSRSVPDLDRVPVPEFQPSNGNFASAVPADRQGPSHDGDGPAGGRVNVSSAHISQLGESNQI